MILMQAKIIEASQGEKGLNWGKFLVSRLPDAAYDYSSQLPGCEGIEGADRPLLRRIGFPARAIRVDDLQTHEGVFFIDATDDPDRFVCQLEKHKIWVCPMYAPFLAWLGRQPLEDLDALPGFVALPDAPGEIYGYRRKGPTAP